MAFRQNKPTPNSPLNSAEVRDNFKHLEEGIGTEHVWDNNDPKLVKHKLDEINANVTQGSAQRNTVNGYDSTTGAGTLTRFYHHVNKGTAVGVYSLQNLLQELVIRSHSHSVERNLYNCNCNCNCDCGGNN